MNNTTRFFALLLLSAILPGIGHTAGSTQKNYEAARWDPIHFKPAINQASNQQCLSCHEDILQRNTLPQSPAGLKKEDSLAWYQTLGTYAGDQMTFHQRHLSSTYATSVMDLRCTTCHQGSDPRDETSATSATTQGDLTMRKMVDPYVCVMCHGQFPAEKMGVPGSWYESSHVFADSCLTCHAGIKTERHKKAPFLKAAEIETLGKEDSDVCFGCHGGRAWYNIPFPYTSTSWPGWHEEPNGAQEKYMLLNQTDKK
jgi:hypothetical protein